MNCRFLFILMITICAFSIHAKAEILTINKITRSVSSDIDCANKNWQGDPESSCQCCLAIRSLKSKSLEKEAASIITKCVQRNYCSRNKKNMLSLDPLQLRNYLSGIVSNAMTASRLNVKKEDFIHSNLSEPSAKRLILEANKQGFIQTSPHKEFLANPDCFNVKNVGGGGAQTLQLFLIPVNERCATARGPDKFVTKYVLKETKKPTEEITNLRNIENSILKIYDVLNPYRNPNNIAIAFDVKNFSYILKGKRHYLSLLTAAPGVSLKKLVNDYAHNPKPLEQDVIQTFYTLGFKLAHFHKSFMDYGKGVLRPTYVHGDLHMDNVFVAPEQNYLITLIDNETLAKSMRRKTSVAVDLYLLYGFSVAQLSNKYLKPEQISYTTWHRIMLEPFLKGYIMTWNKEDRAQVWKELRSILMSPTPITSVIKDRPLFINPGKYQYMVSKYVRPSFDNVLQTLRKNNEIY